MIASLCACDKRPVVAEGQAPLFLDVHVCAVMHLVVSSTRNSAFINRTTEAPVENFLIPNGSPHCTQEYFLSMNNFTSLCLQVLLDV